MLCEHCKKNEATIHFHEAVDGQVHEVHLCADCAKSLGYDQLLGSPYPFAGMTEGWQDFLGSLFSQAMPSHGPRGKVCSFCGTSFEEFAKTAMAGCPHCYREFYNELLPSVERIHGKTHHVGKIPRSASREVLRRRQEAEAKQQVVELKHRLDEAVQAQAYEEAAKLRDRIREMEKGGESK